MLEEPARSIERGTLAWVVLSVPGVIAVQGLVVLAGKVLGAALPAPLPLSLVVAVAVPLLALPLAGARAVQRRLPASLDGARRRHPWVAGMWLLLGVAAVSQAARLSAFMVDPELRWASAFPPSDLAVEHQCLPAYLHAAELQRRGVVDVYDPDLWPLTSGFPEQPQTVIRGMQPLIDDPFLYPPVFLLLPRAAIALSVDYAFLRSAVFAVNALLFLAAALALVRWIGGARGLAAGLLLPAVWIGIPTGLNLQFGQFHLAAFALSVAAMLLFESRRPALGGALLALASGCVVFPGILVVYLAFQRRWRELAWTAAFGAAWVGLGVAVLGWPVFEAFLTEHLPRLSSGEAVAFFEEDAFSVSQNGSLYGLVFKLRELGVPGMTRGLASVMSGVFPLLVVALAALAARRGGSRGTRALHWLALLGLLSLRSPYVPVGYAYSSGLWLLSLSAPDARARWPWVTAVVVAWVLVHGLPPMPDDTLQIALSLGGPVVLLCLSTWVIARRPQA